MASTVELNIVIKDQASGAVKNVRVELGELSKTSKEATSSFGAMGAQYAKFAAGVAAATAVVGGTVAAVAAAVNELVQLGSTLTDLSARTGVTTQAIQELSYAGSLVGVSFDSVAPALAIMQRNLVAGKDAFSKLGLEIADLRAMKPEQQFVAVAQAINGIEDPTLKSALAMEVFGRGAGQIMALLKSDIAGAAEEARRLGVVLGDDTVAAADRMGDATTRLDAAWSGLKNRLAAVVVESGLVGWLETAAAGVGKLSTAVRDMDSSLSDASPAQQAFLEFLMAIGPTAAQNVAQISELGQLLGSLQGPESAGAPKVGMGIFAPPTQPSVQGPTPAEIAAMDAGLTKLIRTETEAAEATKRLRVEQFELGLVVRDVGDAGMDDLGSALFAASTASLTLSSNTSTLGVEFGSVTGSAEELNEAIARGNALELASAQASNAAANATHKTGVEAKEAAVAAELLSQAIIGAGFALQDFGSGIGGIFGTLVSGIGAATSAWGSYRQEMAHATTDAEKSAAKANLIAGGLGALASATHASLDSASAASRATAGAAMGAQIGAVAGPWGAAAGAVVGAIVGAFKKPSWVKVGQEAGKILGMEVSKELAKAIEDTSKKLNVSVANATLLHLSEAMDESGKAATAFAPQMSDLLEAIDSGAVPAQEGIEALGQAFNQLTEEAAAGSVAAMAQMGALAAQARALGQEIPEVTAAVASAVQDSVGALGGVGGIKIVSEADARSQAQIFLNVFNSVLATEGIVAAAQAIKPGIDEFRKQLEAAGIGKGAADAILGPINSAMSLLKNDMTKGGAEGAQALKTILESQLKAGFLDVNTFAAIQQQTKTTFDQMIAGGADTGAAFQAVAPLLAQLQQTAVATGQALDPVTAQLIEQAKAAGVAFPTDTGQQMVTLLGQVVELLGGVPAVVAPIGPAFDAASSQTTTSLQSIPAAAGAAFSTTLQNASSAGTALAATFVSASDQANFALLSIGQVQPDTAPVEALQGDIKDLIALALQAKGVLSGLGGNVGSIAIGEIGPGRGGAPGLQSGGYVPEIPSLPSGTHVRLAERGTGGEYAIPGKAMESMAHAMWQIAAAVAHGSGGDTILDGEVVARAVARRTRDNDGGSLTLLNQGTRRRGGG